jgi:2,3-bisphosphoglycerate-independent phosphoglycerate mutase
MPQVKPVLLCVLDGWGLRAETSGNAIALAGTPQMDAFRSEFPWTELSTSGLAVGLPEGQMGNSEVGHTNLGAGRIVYQDLVRINLACEQGDLDDIPALRLATEPGGGRALHLIGLVSDGGVHSSMEHLEALVALAQRRGVTALFVHAFTDGRDTAPRSGLGFVQQTEETLARIGLGKIATVSGRYFAMDRDQRWDRVELAYRALTAELPSGAPGEPRASSGSDAVAKAYARGESDEFIRPTAVVDREGAPVGLIRDGDSVLCFNFRADRVRELTRALAAQAFDGFERKALKLASYVCLTEYDRELGLPVAFPPDQPKQILPELISNAGMRQFRCAETEKYAHVTFFFNGGREQIFPGEERVLVPSPRDVPTYDLKPEMSAPQVASEVERALASEDFQFLLVNFANPDMVGHTGILPAAIRAVRTVDECLGRLWKTARAHGARMAVTADHGNCEMMIDPVTGEPHTQHTLNPVPFHLVDPELRGAKLRRGILADVAPTLLELLGLPQPPEMNRRSLLSP